MNTLLPLYVNPLVDPAAWDAVAGYPAPLTVVVNVADGPGSGLDPLYTQAIGRLAGAGISVLGYLDLGLATRPAAQVRAEVGRWAGYQVDGIFFDQAPTSPYSIGPVAVAVAQARRVGLEPLVLNPAMPTDPLYRELGVTICSYEGGWPAYRRFEGGRPGDAVLLYGVPPAEFTAAGELVTARGAGYGLISDQVPPDPYTAPPSWCTIPAPIPVDGTPVGVRSGAGDAAGTSGRRMTSGS
jgi:hypothetical protein